jgi:hypothetical protein
MIMNQLFNLESDIQKIIKKYKENIKKNNLITIKMMKIKLPLFIC